MSLDFLAVPSPTSITFFPSPISNYGSPTHTSDSQPFRFPTPAPSRRRNPPRNKHRSKLDPTHKPKSHPTPARTRKRQPLPDYASDSAEVDGDDTYIREIGTPPPDTHIAALHARHSADERAAFGLPRRASLLPLGACKLRARRRKEIQQARVARDVWKSRLSAIVEGFYTALDALTELEKSEDAKRALGRAGCVAQIVLMGSMQSALEPVEAVRHRAMKSLDSAHTAWRVRHTVLLDEMAIIGTYAERVGKAGLCDVTTIVDVLPVIAARAEAVVPKLQALYDELRAMAVWADTWVSEELEVKTVKWAIAEVEE